MSMLSIPSYKTDDPNYRYKMPKLVAKVEGRGNGIRTNIINMGDIARALKRPPDYPTKFCGHELGSQSKFVEAQGHAIVNGAHEQKDLQTLIDKFIDKFVLCQNCNLPEIDLQLKKGRVTYRCNACGNSGEVDNTHKLATFILKNPPDGGDSTMGAKKKTKEERQRERALKVQSKSREDIDSDDTKEKKEKKEKKKKDKDGKAKKSSSKSKSDGSTGSDDEQQQDCEDGEQPKNGSSVSTASSLKKSRSGGASPTNQSEDEGEKKSSKKKKSKKDGKTSSNQGTTEALEELGYTSPEVVDVIQNLLDYSTTVSEDGKRSWISTINGNDFFDHLRLLQVTQGFDHRVKLYVALDVLFHSELGGLTPALLEKKSKFLIPVTQNMTPRDILAALEDFVMMRTEFVSGGFKNFPYFVQKLYSADILTDEKILKHYSSKKAEAEGRESYSKAKIAAKPFLDFLQQSDSEDDSGSDDSEDDEETTTTMQQQKLKSLGTIAPVAGVQEPLVPLTKATDMTQQPVEDDDDVDIDDI